MTLVTVFFAREWSVESNVAFGFCIWCIYLYIMLCPACRLINDETFRGPHDVDGTIKGLQFLHVARDLF